MREDGSLDLGVSDAFGLELHYDVLLVEAYVAQGDVLEQGACLRGAAECEQHAAAFERLYEVAAGAVFGHADGLSHHEVDAGATAVAEVDIAADNLVDGDVEADVGRFEEHVDVVADTHGVWAAVHQGQSASCFLLNQIADFAVCESEFHDRLSVLWANMPLGFSLIRR